MRPRSAQTFLWAGLIAWLLVTAAAIVVIVQSPADHAGLAIGVLVIWVVLIVFAGFALVTENLGDRRR